MAPWRATKKTACAGLDCSKSNALTSTFVSKTTRLFRLAQDVLEDFRRQTTLLSITADTSHYRFETLLSLSYFKKAQTKDRFQFALFLIRDRAKCLSSTSINM